MFPKKETLLKIFIPTFIVGAISSAAVVFYKREQEREKEGRFLYVAPRILAIFFILFVSIFAFDVFTAGYGFWESILAFLIHLVPTYILIGALFIAWRWELPGGLVFIALGLIYLAMAVGKASVLAMTTMVVPPLTIGALFLLNNFLSREL